MMYCEVNVGERIRYFRNLRGWSQETLALQAEINPAFLGHLERGLKSPTIKTLEKIVRALDISLAELFADPQPVDNARDAVIAQVCDQKQRCTKHCCTNSFRHLSHFYFLLSVSTYAVFCFLFSLLLQSVIRYLRFS